VVWPAASAVALWAAAVMAMRRFDALTNAIAVGTLAAGFLPLLLWLRRSQRSRSAARSTSIPPFA